MNQSARGILFCFLLSAFCFSTAGQVVTNLPAIRVPSNNLSLYLFSTDGGSNDVRMALTNLFQPPLTNATGANGSNFVLLLIPSAEQHFFVGGSNLNFLAIYGGTLGFPQRFSIWATNLTGENGAMTFSAVTNRWFFSGPLGETNAPFAVWSNNFRWHGDGVVNGSNVWLRYRYYKPAQ